MHWGSYSVAVVMFSPSDQAGLAEGGFLMLTETAFQLHQ